MPLRLPSSLEIAEWLLWRKVRRMSHFTEQEQLVARRLLRTLVRLTPDDVLATVEYQRSETDILSDRLGRRYDPGMALQEATNRALALKKVSFGQALTTLQEAALEFQKDHARRTVRNAR